MNKVVIVLSILIYLLVYLVRFNQGGWDVKVEIFKVFRSTLDKQVGVYLPSPHAELLSGIILGQNKDLPGELKLALRDTSTLHIVVASGQNLNMVAGFFLLLSGLIKRKLAIFLSFLAIIFYTLLTGAEVPILRAAAMVSLGFLAQVFGRERESIFIVIGVGALMLLINPNWITSLSFQLSFMATLGVVSVAPIILRRLESLPRFIGSDLAVSLGAQMMVLPIIASNFHQLSLVSIPANLMVLWTIPFIMIGGVIFLVVSWIPALGWFLAQVLNALLTYFIYIVQFFASLPFAWEYVGQFHWIVWVGYYLIVYSILNFLSNFKKSP